MELGKLHLNRVIVILCLIINQELLKHFNKFNHSLNEKYFPIRITNDVNKLIY